MPILLLKVAPLAPGAESAPKITQTSAKPLVVPAPQVESTFDDKTFANRTFLDHGRPNMGRTVGHF